MSQPDESESPIQVEHRGRIAIWTLARPSCLNALTLATVQRLEALALATPLTEA
jgi:enoyl-CoA hydratase/carnithine racemase